MREQYERQARFTDQYLRAKFNIKSDEMLALLGAMRIELTKEYVLALHREADEILDEVPWKGHRSYDPGDPIRSNVAEEIVDVVKYAWGLAHIWGLTYDELIREIDVKSDVVEDRWRQEHEEPWGTGPIVLLDLDGVLSPYPAPFLRWMSVHPKYSRIMEMTGLDMAELERMAPESKAFAKHEYRQSGAKRTLPASASSVLAVQRLAAAGYEIVILSQRPAAQYKRIYGDTVYWLHANKIPYRRLIFATKKEHRLLLSPILGRIAFAVDDDPDVVDRLRDLGIRTYLLVGNVTGLGPDAVGSMLQIPEVPSA